MTSVIFEDSSVELMEGESLLDGLLRSGHEIAHGCKAGVCQSCLVEAKEGDIPSGAQKGLSDAQVALGQLLSCQCHPDSEIHIKQINNQEQAIPAELISKDWLNDQVLRLRFKADLDYKAGQYLTLWKDQLTARSYSIASYPEQDDYIECQIKVIEGGQFSQWAANELEVGDSLSLQGPMGKCFYTASPDQSVLLAAIGTGLAPVYGILKEALAKEHKAPIDLVIGAKDESGFYLSSELKSLSEQYENLTVHWVAQTADAKEGSDVVESDIYDYVKSLIPDMKGYKVYLCGADSFVKKLRKNCFLAGAGMGDIAADVFLPAS